MKLSITILKYLVLLQISQYTKLVLLPCYKQNLPEIYDAIISHDRKRAERLIFP